LTGHYTSPSEIGYASLDWKPHMERHMDVLTEQLKELKSVNNVGAGTLPIPSKLDAEISSILGEFVSASREERVACANLFTSEHAFTLISFAERMATLAVRTHDPHPLFDALVAVMIDDGKFDIREDILVLAPIYDAAVRLSRSSFPREGDFGAIVQ
jgi:hypothetical protein